MNKRLLFVDDEVAILQGLKRALRPQRQEWDMVFVASAEQALQLLQQSYFDVLITDMRMPGMDGADLLQAVIEHSPHTLRLVLSGQADEQRMAQTINTAHQFLTKPCSVGQLITTLQKIFALDQIVPQANIRHRLAAIQELPAHPLTLKNLQAVLVDPGLDLTQVADLVCSDPVMAVRVLQMVNGGFYGGQQSISDCRQALQQIGADSLKALIQQRGLLNSYDLEETTLDGFSSTDILAKGALVGRLARRIALQQGYSNSFAESCYLSGLLHDIGILVLENAWPDEYAEIKAQAQHGQASLISLEQERLGTHHAKAGAYLAGLWGLPEPIVSAIAWHHQPSALDDPSFSPLSALHLADWLVHQRPESAYQEKLEADDDYLQQLGWRAQQHDWQQLLSEELAHE